MLSTWEHSFEKPTPVIVDDVGYDIGMVLDIQNQELLIVARGMGQVIQYPAVINGDDAVSKSDTRTYSDALEPCLPLNVPFYLLHKYGVWTMSDKSTLFSTISDWSESNP